MEKFVKFVAVELPIVLSVVFYFVNVKRWWRGWMIWHFLWLTIIMRQRSPHSILIITFKVFFLWEFLSTTLIEVLALLNPSLIGMRFGGIECQVSLGAFLFLCEHGLHSYAVNQVMRLKTRSPWKQFGVAECFYIRVCFVLWHHVQAFQFHSKLICSRHLSLIVNTLPHWRAVCRVTFLWNQAWTVQKSSRSCTNCWADVCSFAALVPCNQKWWRQQALLLTRRTFLQ